MNPNINDYVNSEIPIKKHLLSIFSETDRLVIFDIGACEGEDTIRYSKLFPNSLIFTFEPLHKNIERIKKNFDNYKISNAKLFPIALCNNQGKAKFYISTGKPENSNDNWDYGNKSSSLLQPDKILKVHKWLKFTESILVNTDTLKNICNENNVTEIDIIHMDVQGAELKVLKGSDTLLQGIKVIWMEVDNLQMYKKQPLKHQIQKFLISNGFSLIKISESEVTGDQLYINNALIDSLDNSIFEIENFKMEYNDSEYYKKMAVNCFYKNLKMDALKFMFIAIIKSPLKTQNYKDMLYFLRK